MVLVKVVEYIKNINFWGISIWYHAEPFLFVINHYWCPEILKWTAQRSSPVWRLTNKSKSCNIYMKDLSLDQCQWVMESLPAGSYQRVTSHNSYLFGANHLVHHWSFIYHQNVLVLTPLFGGHSIFINVTQEELIISLSFAKSNSVKKSNLPGYGILP